MLRCICMSSKGLRPIVNHTQWDVQTLVLVAMTSCKIMMSQLEKQVFIQERWFLQMFLCTQENTEKEDATLQYKEWEEIHKILCFGKLQRMTQEILSWNENCKNLFEVSWCHVPQAWHEALHRAVVLLEKKHLGFDQHMCVCFCLSLSLSLCERCNVL